jgi:hypothetical protein
MIRQAQLNALESAFLTPRVRKKLVPKGHDIASS